MDEQRTFVGRQAELNRFREILEDPAGQAIVVVGQAGMGKTWLLDQMALLATEHPTLQCGWVRYEVTPTDSPDSTMALMMDHAFEAAKQSDGFFEITDRSRKQWAALFKTFIPKGGDILELLASLKRDPQKHTREQFLDRLHLISRRMSSDGRALFVIDPEKLMCPGCADSWRLVTGDLPNKIKFLFAQRPEDELINSNAFMALGNIIRLPNEPLDILAPEDVDELVRSRADDIGQSGQTLRDAMGRYQGHPYAIQAAMEIVKKTKHIEDLPQDPTNEGIAATQWRQICRTGENAIRLFEAYAILEVAVPQDVVEAVSGLNIHTMKRLLSDTYLSALLRQELQGSRIYHALLADHIGGQIDQNQQKALHGSAIHLYRTRLKEAREQCKAPDFLAAVRLPEHVLAADGTNAFVVAFVNECATPLFTLGLFDEAMNLSRRSLDLVERGSANEAAAFGWLGLIHRERGDLDQAEETHKKAIGINQRLGRSAELATEYGNLALIYRTRGDLDGAERMHNEALEIDQRFGHLEGMANQYGGLAGVYESRGDFDRAEKMLAKTLEINHKLGRLEGMASTYGNLGLIFRKRDDIDEAEKMFTRSLEIFREMGHPAGIADQYTNLGLVYEARNDLNEAERMYGKALEINKGLGRFEGMAIQFGNLGLIHRARGELDAAEGMLNQALEINQRLGRIEGIAIQYGSLGLVCQSRADFTKAREHWEKAMVLFQKIGATDRIRIVRIWISSLPKGSR